MSGNFRWTLSLLAMGLMLAIFSANAFADSHERFTLTFNVTNNETGQPLDDAQIDISGTGTVYEILEPPIVSVISTCKTGELPITCYTGGPDATQPGVVKMVVGPGSYNIRIGHEVFVALSGSLTLPNPELGNNIDVNAPLEPDPNLRERSLFVNILGRYINPDGSERIEPIDGAKFEVFATGADGGFLGGGMIQLAINPSGETEWRSTELIIGEEILIRASAEGFITQDFRLTVGAGEGGGFTSQSDAVIFTLEQATNDVRTLVVEVLDADTDEPVANASVDLQEIGGASVASGRTGSDGRTDPLSISGDIDPSFGLRVIVSQLGYEQALSDVPPSMLQPRETPNVYTVFLKKKAVSGQCGAGKVCVFLVTNVDQLDFGDDASMEGRKRCNYQGGGRCGSEGGDTPIEFIVYMGPFDSKYEANKFYCDDQLEPEKGVRLTAMRIIKFGTDGKWHGVNNVGLRCPAVKPDPPTNPDPPSDNRAPTVSLDVSPANPTTADAIRLTAKASDPDNDRLEYAWFVNGIKQDASAASVVINNPSAGSFEIRVTVSDGKGQSASATKTVTVTESCAATASIGQFVPQQACEAPDDEVVTILGIRGIVEIETATIRRRARVGDKLKKGDTIIIIDEGQATASQVDVSLLGDNVSLFRTSDLDGQVTIDIVEGRFQDNRSKLRLLLDGVKAVLYGRKPSEIVYVGSAPDLATLDTRIPDRYFNHRQQTQSVGAFSPQQASDAPVIYSVEDNPAQNALTLSVERGGVEVSSSGGPEQTVLAGEQVSATPSGLGPVIPIEQSLTQITSIGIPTEITINEPTDWLLSFSDDGGNINHIKFEQWVNGQWVSAGEGDPDVWGMTQGSLTITTECKKPETVRARVTIRDSEGHSATQEYQYQCVTGSERPSTSLSIPEALDANHNNALDDNEVRAAIQMWILGQTVPGTTDTINDATMRELVEMWILGTPVRQAAAAVLSAQALGVRSIVLQQAGPLLRVLEVRGQNIAGVGVWVFDLGGRLQLEAQSTGSRLGFRLVNPSGRPLANGVYLYRIAVEGRDGRVRYSPIRKLAVLR